MTLGLVWNTLVRGWKTILVAALVAALAAFVYTRLPWTEPRWRSSVWVQASGRLDYGNSLAIGLELRPLAEEVLQLSTMAQVDSNLHTDLGAQKLLGEVKANPVQDSSEVQIDVEDPDPARAQQLAVEIARVYSGQHNAVQQGLLREERVLLTPLDRDTTARLIWPQTKLLVPAAAALGAVVAAAVLLAMAYLSDALRTPEEVFDLVGLPVLAMIPASTHARQNSSSIPLRAFRPRARPLSPPSIERARRASARG